MDVGFNYPHHSSLPKASFSYCIRLSLYEDYIFAVIKKNQLLSFGLKVLPEFVLLMLQNWFKHIIILTPCY